MDIIKNIGFGSERPNDIDYRMQPNGFAEVWLYNNIQETEDGFFADGVFFMSKLKTDEILRRKDTYFKEDTTSTEDSVLEELKSQINKQNEIINLLLNKQGYKLEEIGTNTLELVKDEESDIIQGDYLNPINYTNSMTVTKGLWYTDSVDIWECIKSGTPKDFTDTDYFDIIIV